jgi:hypothetical protein
MKFQTGYYEDNYSPPLNSLPTCVDLSFSRGTEEEFNKAVGAVCLFLRDYSLRDIIYVNTATNTRPPKIVECDDRVAIVVKTLLDYFRPRGYCWSYSMSGSKCVSSYPLDFSWLQATNLMFPTARERLEAKSYLYSLFISWGKEHILDEAFPKNHSTEI